MMILDRFAMPSAKIRKGQVIRPFQSSRRWLAPRNMRKLVSIRVSKL